MTDDRRDPETGQFSETFSDAELVEAVKNSEPIGTSEIAEQFGCTQQAAYNRLSRLEDNEKISSKLVGGSRVWMSSNGHY